MISWSKLIMRCASNSDTQRREIDYIVVGKLIVVGHRKADGNFQLAAIPKSIRIFDEQIQIERCLFKAHHLSKIQTSHDRHIIFDFVIGFIGIGSLISIKILSKFQYEFKGSIQFRNETSKGDESINFTKFLPVLIHFETFGSL